MNEVKDFTAQISSYQPTQDVVDLTIDVRRDYAEGMRILQQPWPELNFRSIIDDMNRGQMMFNAFVDTAVEDPNEAWKWRGTRSMARNKGIAMHAQLTATYLLPMFVAQNENDEVDRDFSEVMRDIIEWMAQPTNSDYQTSFLQIVYGMMQNPVTYMGAEYYEIYQKIKELAADGTMTTKEILDMVLSGFKAPIWSANQVLITNVYERNIQKQRRIIKRRWPEYEEMEAKYGQHPNWKYVTKGYKSIYNDEDGLFYDVKDVSNPNLVTEEFALERRSDSEIPYVNGIYLGDEDVDANPIKHRDNRNAPKYNIVPFGYMRIGEHFFYYKSMMNALSWDNAAYDAMSEIVFNRAILENEVPVAISGVEKVDSSIIFPNAVIAFDDPDTKITPILPPANISDGFASLRESEKSMSEGSVSDVTAGQLPDKDQKAYSVSVAQANAKKNISAIGKGLAESITQMGDLMKDIAINHITAPQVEELLGGVMKLKYRSFMLENKKSGGKLGKSVIKFDEELIGMELTPAELETKKLKLLETTGYPHEIESIRLINPEMFAKFNYLCKVDVEEMFTKNNEYWQPIIMNLKRELENDPYIDQIALDRKLVYSIFNSEGESLIKEPQQMAPGMAPMGPQGAPGAAPALPRPPTNPARFP